MHKTSRHFLRTSGFYTQPLVFTRDVVIFTAFLAFFICFHVFNFPNSFKKKCIAWTIFRTFLCSQLFHINAATSSVINNRSSGTLLFISTTCTTVCSFVKVI